MSLDQQGGSQVETVPSATKRQVKPWIRMDEFMIALENSKEIPPKTKKPKSVSVCGYTYKIKYVKRPEKHVPKKKMTSHWGITILDDQMIYIKKDLPEAAIRDTLLHEILHVVWYLCALATHENLDEESIVCPTSTMLFATMRTNKELFTYLMEEG